MPVLWCWFWLSAKSIMADKRQNRWFNSLNFILRCITWFDLTLFKINCENFIVKVFVTIERLLIQYNNFNLPFFCDWMILPNKAGKMKIEGFKILLYAYIYISRNVLPKHVHRSVYYIQCTTSVDTNISTICHVLTHDQY